MRGKILGAITVVEADRFLTDWANLANNVAAIDRFVRRNGAIVSPIVESGEHKATAYALITLRDHLRNAWDSADRRKRDWSIFQLRRKFAEWSLSFSITDAEELVRKPQDWFEQCPDVTPLEAAMFYFQTIGNRAKHCASSECPAPYFIANDSRNKHCSEQCAADATKDSKRRSWHRNKQIWTKK